jgi:hypothetical protein
MFCITKTPCCFVVHTSNSLVHKWPILRLRGSDGGPHPRLGRVPQSSRFAGKGGLFVLPEVIQTRSIRVRGRRIKPTLPFSLTNPLDDPVQPLTESTRQLTYEPAPIRPLMPRPNSAGNSLTLGLRTEGPRNSPGRRRPCTDYS